MPNSTIWKYTVDRPMNTYGEFELDLPIGCEILSCQIQDNALRFWVKFDVDDNFPDVKKEAVKFYIVGTGKLFQSNDLEFITTVQQLPFVWHMFKKRI